MLMKNPMHKQNGFTLTELMITVAIAAILLAIGVPSMREFIQNGRITAVTNELVSALMVARSEAIRKNTTTCVCPTANANVVTPVCAANGNWETGWIAFSDFNGDCVINGAAPAADVLLNVWDGSQYAGQITVRNDDPTITLDNTVRFNSRGEPFNNGVPQTGNFSICDDRPISNVDAQGNVRMASAVIV
ncbi:MAG: type fimbrial biosis protein FimT, partial [Pseudomonadota bacterium]|nr:type fimbrial biosis protein FimT [Pseudomonadota bacterium]